MDASLLCPSRFIKSADFEGKDVTITVADVTLEVLETDRGPKSKGVVTLEGNEKAWVLNKTNVLCLIAMFGKETKTWHGKRVTLWPAPFTDPTTGEETTCIRIRGSPDLSADITFDLKLPRKKAKPVTMRRTGGRATAERARQAAKGETPFDRLTRVAKERGHEWPAVKEGLARLGKTKRSEVTDEVADQVLAWLNPEPPPAEPDGFDDHDDLLEPPAAVAQPAPAAAAPAARPANGNGRKPPVIIDQAEGETEAQARARAAAEAARA